MQLALAIVQTCTRTGCQVRLLGTQRDLDTRYSTQIVRYKVEIRPGDLVVVDVTQEDAASPRTVFCFARTLVERVQTLVRTDRHPGDLSPIEGLGAPLQPGDWVFATLGGVYDRCDGAGLPADPERLWAEAGPMVESIVQPAAPEPEKK